MMLEVLPVKNRVMIDLHGLSVKETKEVLAKRFREIEEYGSIEFYIITGKGNHVNSNGTRGVLKKILPKLLKPYSSSITEINPEIGAYRIILNKQVKKGTLEALVQYIFSDPKENQYVQDLHKKAQDGDIDSMLFVASVYFMQGIEEEKAIQFLDQAKNLGSLEAVFLLGEFYCKKSEYRKAVSYFEYGVERNHLECLHALASCYLLGQGVMRNDEKGVELLIKAADQGHMCAQGNLGRSYYVGDYSPRNIGLAVKYLTMASNQGMARAKTYLARCYATGDGVKQDSQKAFDLYLEAAQGGEVYAIYQVGQYILDARSGEPANREKAFPWFKWAADLGDSDGQFQTAVFLLYVKQDSEAGIQYLEKSIDQKNGFAFYEKAVMYEEGRLVKKEIKVACDNMRLAAENKCPSAQFEWGIYLITGIIKGIGKDVVAGKEWIRRSAKENGHANNVLEYLEACQNNYSDRILLGELYFLRAMHYMDYVDIKPHRENAQEYLKTALEYGCPAGNMWLAKHKQTRLNSVNATATTTTKSGTEFFKLLTPNSMLEQAKVHYTNHHYEQAIPLYQELLVTSRKNDAGIFCNLGHCYYGLKQYEKAIEYYSNALAIDNKRIAAYEWRARSYRNQAKKLMSYFGSNENLICQAEQDEEMVSQLKSSCYITNYDKI